MIPASMITWAIYLMLRLTKGRSIRKLMAGACEVQKNIRAMENQREKNHARPVTLKNIHAMA